MFLPTHFGSVSLHGPICEPGAASAYACITSASNDEVVGDIFIYDKNDRCVVSMQDVVCRRNEADDQARSTYFANNCYVTDLVSSLSSFSSEEVSTDPLVTNIQVLQVGKHESVSAEEDSRGSHVAISLTDVPPAELVPSTFAALKQIIENDAASVTIIGSPDQTWLLGMRRVAEAATNVPIRTILASNQDGDTVSRLMHRTDLRETVIVDGEIFVEQLRRAEPDELLPTGHADAHSAHGTVYVVGRGFDAVKRFLEPSEPLGPGDVRVAVEAVPLIWKDVGKVLGTLGFASSRTLSGTGVGVGFAGKVVAVGTDARFEVGDRVFGMGQHPLRQFYRVCEGRDFVRRLPADLDPAIVAAHTLPWMTALAVIDDQLQLRERQRVFVPSGAGALGSALCRLAIMRGAEVVTSVGQDEKIQRVLEISDSIEVIVARGADIPSTLQHNDFLEFDAIVSTLNGAERVALLGMLRPGGRCVDVGKPASTHEITPAAALDRNRTLTAFDIDQLAVDDPETLHELFDRAVPYIADTDNHVEANIHSIRKVGHALSELARGSTKGGVVVRLDDATPAPRVARFTADPDAAYLISGGYGAVGMTAAHWLASRGALTLWLVGRSGHPTAAAQNRIELLRAAGIDVRVVACDVAVLSQVRSLQYRLEQVGHPIAGVFHAAGTTNDNSWTDIDGDQVRASFGPKVVGAVNLAEAVPITRDGFFVVTSSVSGVIGVPIQGTYAAANTELDGFAERLRRRGRHACSIQLGPVEGDGMAAEEDVQRYYRALGLVSTRERDLFRVFDHAAVTDRSTFMFADTDWRKMGRALPGTARTHLTAGLIAEAIESSDGEGIDELLDLPVDQRAEVIGLIVANLFADTLGVDPEDLSADRSFDGLGVDSLTVVEVQASLNDILHTDLNLAGLFDADAPIGELAFQIAVEIEEQGQS